MLKTFFGSLKAFFFPEIQDNDDDEPIVFSISTEDVQTLLRKQLEEDEQYNSKVTVYQKEYIKNKLFGSQL